MNDELGNLLKSDSLSNDLKMRLFNDLLHKHLDKLETFRKPKRTEKQKTKHDDSREEALDEKPPVEDAKDSESEYFSYKDDSVYEKPKRAKTDNLEEKILSLVETDKIGRVLRNGRIIANSNIKNIGKHIVSGSTKKAPAGTSHVFTLLKYKPVLAPIIRSKRIQQRRLKEAQVGSGHKVKNIRWENLKNF